MARGISKQHSLIAAIILKTAQYLTQYQLRMKNLCECMSQINRKVDVLQSNYCVLARIMCIY